MALFIKQEIDKTELQKRIAKDLQDKAKNIPDLSDNVDLVEDSQYIKGTKKTTTLAWAWILILVVFIIMAVLIISNSLAK